MLERLEGQINSTRDQREEIDGRETFYYQVVNILKNRKDMDP
jgi:hypothetical protein